MKYFPLGVILVIAGLAVNCYLKYLREKQTGLPSRAQKLQGGSTSRRSVDQLEEIRLIWRNNEELWRTRIEPEILIPLEKVGGVGTPGTWENIVATAFGRSLQTFESVQMLSNPSNPRRLWTDAFILTRIHFETFVTIEWLSVGDHEARVACFEDEYPLKMAYLLDQLGELREQVQREKREQIYRNRDEVLSRHGRSQGTLNLTPSLADKVREVARELPQRHQHLLSQYQNYYRDVSGFAHPSAWGLVGSLSDIAPEIQSVEPPLRVGYLAVFCNGGWFLKVLDCWNRVFKKVPAEKVDNWFKEWVLKSGSVDLGTSGKA